MDLNEAIKHCHEKAEEIRKANEEMPTDCKLSEDLCECANEHEQLAGWLTELQERREADKWILVSEKIPEVSGWHLVTRLDSRGNRITDMAYYLASFKDFSRDDVIAWLPLLPKPYESEAKNE